MWNKNKTIDKYNNKRSESVNEGKSRRNWSTKRNGKKF